MWVTGQEMFSTDKQPRMQDRQVLVPGDRGLLSKIFLEVKRCASFKHLVHNVHSPSERMLSVHLAKQYDAAVWI